MKSNDDLLSVQGTVRTLVDAEGYLVREDIKGERKRYPTSVSGNVYSAGEGLSLDETTFSVDFNEVAKPYSVGSGLILSGQQISVDYDKVCKNVDDLSASDKDKLNKLVLELDWDNSENITQNVTYQASRSGLVTVRAERGELPTMFAAIVCWGPNQDGSDTGDNYFAGQTAYSSTGNIVCSHFVFKGDSYVSQCTAGATVKWCKFIPFKNSIAISNS